MLFDRDGTLVDFNRAWFRLCMSLAEQAAVTLRGYAMKPR